MILDGASARANWALAELKQWISPHFNPFVGQMRATESRGKSLWRLPLITAMIWAVAMLFDWSAYPSEPHDFARDGALLWIGLVFIAAFCGRLLRCAAMLRIEIIKHRFEPLQLLPIESARRAWLLCAPPTLFALSTCALALPALMWGLGGGLFDASDALGLIFVALLISWGRPLWRPTMWRGQLTKNAVEIGNRSDGFRAPPAPPGDAGLWRGAGIVLVAALLFAGIALTPLAAYGAGLPAYLLATASEFYLTWPLFAARWLMEAQPFFGFTLAPIFLILPLWLARVHNSVLRLGAVTASEPYWTRSRLRHWRIARKTGVIATFLLIFGLLWPGSLDAGWMSLMFLRAPITRQTALGGWWIAFLALASLGASVLWIKTMNNGPSPTTTRSQIGRAMRASARAAAQVAALYIGVHLLGWAWPFGPFWRHIAPASLAVAFIFWGATAVSWTSLVATPFKDALRRPKKIWIYGALVVFFTLVFIVFSLFDDRITLSLFLPWTLWIALQDLGIGHNPNFWLAVAVHGALVLTGAALIWRARDFEFQCANPTRNDETATPSSSAWQPVIAPMTVTAAQAWDEWDEDDAAETPVASSAATVTRRPPLDTPTNHLVTLLNFLERFDNPLLTLETRRVVGNGVSNTVDVAILLNGLIAFVLFIIVLPLTGWVRGAFPFDYLLILLGLILGAIFVATWRDYGGASRAYDTDRLDGSLQALFLTPRTEREIAIGKLGPYVANGALRLFFYAPTWLVGFIFSFYAREPLFIAAYAAAPIFAAAFALRLDATAHWIALARRKVGVGFAPIRIVLPALMLLCGEISVIALTAEVGAPALFGACLVLALAYVFEALLMWRLGVRALRKWRLRGVPVAN